MILQNLNPSSIDHLKKYSIKKFLGDGEFGLVEVCQCKQLHNGIICNKTFVVKRIKKKHIWSINYVKETYIESFNREYTIGILLNHENIRKTLDIDRISYSIIFENCPGIDLLDYANLYKSHNTRHLLSYFSQIIEAVRYLHDKSLAHLDLKLENIILNIDTNVIKLVDFGEAVVFKESGKNIEFFDRKGTVQYLAPEIVQIEYSFFADKADIWCCGIIFYNLFYNLAPWEIASTNDNRYKLHLTSIIKNQLNSLIFPDCETCNYYSESELIIIYKIFKMLLQPRPDRRKSISMIKSIFALIKFDKDE
jgi:serine/threonine protein kinase